MRTLMAYAAIVMGILTSGPVNQITLPVVASAMLGAFGVLLHPHTSVVAHSDPEQPAPLP
jgi:hypothetical protein